MAAQVNPRDYLAEMQAQIEEAMACDAPAAVVAGRVVDRLLRGDQELLVEYLLLRAADIIRDEIRYLDRSTRARTRAWAGREGFAEAAAAGDVTGFLDVRYVVDDTHQRLALRDMTGEHLRYVADQYAASARRALMEEAFLRALAKRVGHGVVADVFSEDDIARLRASIS